MCLNFIQFLFSKADFPLDNVQMPVVSYTGSQDVAKNQMLCSCGKNPYSPHERSLKIPKGSGA